MKKFVALLIMAMLIIQPTNIVVFGFDSISKSQSSNPVRELKALSTDSKFNGNDSICRILRSGGIATKGGYLNTASEGAEDSAKGMVSGLLQEAGNFPAPTAPSAYRYVMCKNVDAYNNPSSLTPSFVTSDYRACQNVGWYTGSGYHDLAMNWFYRTGDASWSSVYWTGTWSGDLSAGLYFWSTWIFISGYWPASNPRGWKVEFYDNNVLVSKDYFEVTPSVNPGDKTMCRDVNPNSPWDPIDRTATFRRGVDTKACAWFRWDNMYYFYEPENTCHWIKYEWVDPSGSVVRIAYYYFADYADSGYSYWLWGKCWDSLSISSSTPLGNWQVNVYLDKFLWDSSFPTWYRGFEGPMFTLSFIVTEENRPPLLSNGNVTPTSGYVGTQFTFEVTYTDPDGDNPGDRRHLYIYDNGWSRYDMDYISGTPASGMLYREIMSGFSVGNHNYFFHFNDVNNAEAYYPPDGTYLTFTVFSEDLYSLPAGSKSTDPSNPNLDNTKLLNSISLNGGSQTVTVNPSETVSASCTYQLWSPSNPTELDQLFFIMSWTPSWPPPDGYYIGIYDGMPGLYPGYSGSVSFSFAAPSSPGTYYLYWCSSAHYSMRQGVDTYNQPLNPSAHAKIIVVPTVEPKIRVDPTSLNFETYASTSASSHDLPMISAATFDNHIVVSVNFAGLTVETHESFTFATSDGCEKNMELRKPMIPLKSFLVLLPPNSTLQSITISTIDEVKLPGKYQIACAELPRMTGYRSYANLQTESTEPYPKEISIANRIGHLRGYRVLSLTTFAAKYYSQSGTLIQNNAITITLELDNQKDQTTESMLRTLIEDQTAIEGLVVNPDAIGLYPALATDTAVSYKYVIVTTSDMSNAFQPLADWKSQKLGSSTIVTVSSIESQYPGTDTQEKIRNFLKYAYQNWQTQWVLLGGDVESVPSRGAYGYVLSNTGPIEDRNIPCDLYYSDLDGTWDADGDHIYGETTDGVDLLPELYVGRAPVNTAAEATNFVNKVLTYEQNPPSGYLTKALLIAYWMDSSTNEAVLKDDIASSYLSAYSVTKFYESSLGSGVDKNGVVNAINSGQGMINQASHGNEWSVPPFSISDVDDLQNGLKYFVFYSTACYTNAFDTSDCIAEHFLLNTHGGGVAYIGNSRYGWYYPALPGQGPSDQYDKEFFKFLSQGYKHIGETLAKSKITFVSQSGSDGAFRWIQYCLNLLGDPEMTVHTEEFGKSLRVYNDGDANLNVADIGKRYGAGEPTDWLFAKPTSFTVPVGSTPQEVIVSVDSAGLSPSTYHGWLQIYSNDVTNNPCEVPVTLLVKPSTYSVTVTTSGLPSAYPTHVYIDGVDQGTPYVSDSQPRSFAFKIGETHMISVQEFVNTESNTRYHCPANSQQVNSEATITFNYHDEYFLTVNTDPSLLDAPSGEDWYDTGAIAPISVSPVSGYIFEYWYLDGRSDIPYSTSMSTSVTVDAPHTATAKFTQIECTVTFYTDPAGLSFNITFKGQPYQNNTIGTFTNGTSGLATANAPFGWVLDHWEATGNVKVSDEKTNPTTVTITCGGTLRALYIKVSPEWDVVLTASKEGYSDASDFGVRSDATDGFDPACDEIDPPAPPVGVVSYFWYPNNPSSPVDLRKLSTSKIPPSSLMTWTCKVKPVAIDGTMTISWTAQDISAIPPEYYVFLLNSEGKIVANMRAVTEYSFTAESDTTYTFIIYVGGCYFELRLSVGWNMVSFPCLPEDPKFSNILSGVGYYQVLTWNGTSYIKPVIAEAGRGYWILVLEDTTVTIYGLPVERYELDLPAGWSMIGSIYDCTVNANLVFPGWYQLLTWNGTSYVKTTTIEPGKGYWVCVLQPTHIVVDKSKVMTSPKISSTTLSRTYDRYVKDEGQIAASRIAYNKRSRTLFTRRSGANYNLQTS